MLGKPPGHRVLCANTLCAVWVGFLLPSSVGLAQSLEPEFFASRLSGYFQDGRGFQSQAEPNESLRGRERAWVIQPILALRARQGDDIQHQLTVAVDVVSAASPDAIDVVSSASRENEALTADLQTDWRVDSSTLQFRGQVHVEEYYRSAGLGIGVQHSFADDNASLFASGEMVFDLFDAVQPNGADNEAATRSTFALAAGVSQLLSPSTQASASYSMTGQAGTLETTWNSLPLEGFFRLGDRFPSTRFRHALTGQIQHGFVETDTYLDGHYRFYVDDFDIVAHTVRGTVTQYVGDLWLRAGYRLHSQSEPWFWVEPPTMENLSDRPRTADSDLEALVSHTVTASGRWFYDRSGAITRNSSYIDLGYTGYFRSNSLTAHAVSVGWGRSL